MNQKFVYDTEEILRAARPNISALVAQICQIPEHLRENVVESILADPNTEGDCRGYGWQSLQKMNARDAGVFIQEGARVSFRGPGIGAGFITFGGNQMGGGSRLLLDSGEIDSPFWPPQSQ